MNNTVSIDRFTGMSPIIVPKNDTIRVLRLDEIDTLYVFVQVLNTELKGNQLQDMCQCFGLTYDQVDTTGSLFLKCDSCEEVNQFVRLTPTYGHIYIQGVKNRPIRFVQSYNALQPDIASTVSDPKIKTPITVAIKEADDVEIRHQEELGCGTFCIRPARKIVDETTLGWDYEIMYYGVPRDMMIDILNKDVVWDGLYLFKERHDFACSPVYDIEGNIVGWGQPNVLHDSNECLETIAYIHYNLPLYEDYKARKAPTADPIVVNKKIVFPPYEWVENPDEVLTAVLNATPNDIVMVSKEAWDASMAPLIEQYPLLHVTADEVADYYRNEYIDNNPLIKHIDREGIKLKPQMNFFKVGNMLSNSTYDIVGMVKKEPNFRKVIQDFYETGDENLTEDQFLMASVFVSMLMDNGIAADEGYAVAEPYIDAFVQKTQVIPSSTVKSSYLFHRHYPKVLQPIYTAYHVDEEREMVLAYTHPLSRDTLDETVHMDYWVMYANKVVLGKANGYDSDMAPPVLVSPAPYENWHSYVNDVYSWVLD